MSIHYLLHGPLAVDDAALGPINQLCGLLKLRGTIRILAEVGGGYTGARVFVAEEQLTPDDPQPFTLVFKVARGRVLRRELERYESLRRFFRARNAFAQILEPGLTLQSLLDDYDSAIAYEHAAAPFGRRESTSLKDLVASALDNPAEMPLALDVVETTMHALKSMYAQPEKEFAFHVERYYEDRWLPHFRVVVDEAVLMSSTQWLLTRRRLNPPHFPAEPITPSAVVRGAAEAFKCELEEVVLPVLNVRRPVRDAMLVQESSLSIEIDVSNLPEPTRRLLADQERVSLWAPPEVRDRRYERYSAILHRAFPGEDLSRAAVALGGRWFHSPLHHLSEPLFERTRSCPPTNAVPAHGDLHPGNVLVVGNAPVIIDYGLSEARLPVGVDAARLFGALVRDVYSKAMSIADLAAVLCAVILEEDDGFVAATPRLQNSASLLRIIQRATLAQIGEAGAELWALHLYAFAFIGLKWDAPDPYVEHAACGLLAAVALTRVLGEASPDDLFVARRPTTEPSDGIAPEGPAEILVLVAKFRGSADYDPTARIYQALADNLFEVLPEITRVDHVDREVLSRKDAIVLGRRYQASMVVWGSYDNLGVRPRYEVTRDSIVAKQSMIQLDEATRHALKDKFDVYVTNDLGNEISFLSLAAVGAMCARNLNHSAALDAYKKALSLVSSQDRLHALGGADIYRDIAGILFGLRKVEEALEANARALELAPDDLLTRVQSLTLRAMVEKRSTMPTISELLALVQDRALSEEDAETRDALENVVLTLKAITSPAALKQLTDRARSTPTYTDLSQNRQHGKDVTVHIQKAHDHVLRKEFSRALREFEQALRLNPRCTYAMAGKGQTLAVLDRVPEALAELERALKIDPNEVLVYVALAHIHYELGEYEKSLAYAEKVHVYPLCRQLVLRPWGLALVMLGRGEEAMAMLKTEDVAPDSCWFFEVRSAYFRVSGQYDAAFREIKEGICLDETNATLLEERARIFAAQQQFGPALQDVRRAVSMAQPGTFSRHSAERFVQQLEAAASAQGDAELTMS